MHFEKIAKHLEIISRDQIAASKFKCSNHPVKIERVKFLAKAGVIPNNVSTKTNYLEQVGKIMQKSVFAAQKDWTNVPIQSLCCNLCKYFSGKPLS